MLKVYTIEPNSLACIHFMKHYFMQDLYKQSLLDERVLPQDKVKSHYHTAPLGLGLRTMTFLQVDQIFGNLERIIEINETFLDELHSEIAKAITEIEIGKCFTSLVCIKRGRKALRCGGWRSLCY